MGASVAITGGFSQLLSKDYKKVFFDEYQRTEEEFSKVAKFENSDMNFIKEGQMAGLGAFIEKSEAGPTTFESPTQGNDKTVYFTTFALAAAVSEEAYDDDQTGHLKKLPAELGKAAAYTRDLEFWDMFNNAFNTTYRSGLDSKALCASDHSLVDSDDTDSNVSTSTLSYTALQSACDTFDGLVNEKGIPIIMRPKLLIIPPGLKWLAEELLLSEYKPDSADNNINTLKSIEDLSYMICHYLTSSTSWFLVSDDHDCRFIWRKKASFRNWDDPNTGNAMFKGSMRFATTFFDWRGVYGSSGA
jgi:phage major head subunit gpT-like protein